MGMKGLILFALLLAGVSGKSTPVEASAILLGGVNGNVIEECRFVKAIKDVESYSYRKVVSSYRLEFCRL